MRRKLFFFICLFCSITASVSFAETKINESFPEIERSGEEAKRETAIKLYNLGVEYAKAVVSKKIVKKPIPISDKLLK